MTRFLKRGRMLAVAALLAVLAAVPAAVSAQGTTSQWNGSMTGANEVPANASTATGTFAATLDEAAGTLTWTLSVPAMTSITAAHLHTGAAGTNGPIVLPLFAAPQGSPASSINNGGTAKSADLTGPLQGNFAEFVRAVKAGTIYVNVHSTANPGGEIRAQVVAAGSPTQPTTAVPVAPKTGNAGLASRATPAAAALLAVLAVGVVLGGRLLISRRA